MSIHKNHPKERLDEVSSAKLDRTFLAKLSKWVIELNGNVNVAQRLNIIAIRGLKPPLRNVRG